MNEIRTWEEVLSRLAKEGMSRHGASRRIGAPPREERGPTRVEAALKLAIENMPRGSIRSELVHVLQLGGAPSQPLGQQAMFAAATGDPHLRIHLRGYNCNLQRAFWLYLNHRPVFERALSALYEALHWPLAPSREEPLEGLGPGGTELKSPARRAAVFEAQQTLLEAASRLVQSRTTVPIVAEEGWVALQDVFARCCQEAASARRAIEDGSHASQAGSDAVPTRYGPFSADFRTVRLETWTLGLIRLTDAQGDVCESLWSFRGQSCTAAQIMRRAGLESEKPGDVFKIKKQNKGDPLYEGPLHVFRSLVKVDKRRGTYSMPIARPDWMAR